MNARKTRPTAQAAPAAPEVLVDRTAHACVPGWNLDLAEDWGPDSCFLRVTRIGTKPGSEEEIIPLSLDGRSWRAGALTTTEVRSLATALLAAVDALEAAR
jgi:hypothetical protein